MASALRGLTIGGEGKVAEIDGAYFGGHVRPENLAADRIDRRLAENQSGKRKVVVVMRERDGRTLPQVFASEDAAVSFTALGSPREPSFTPMGAPASHPRKERIWRRWCRRRRCCIPLGGCYMRPQFWLQAVAGSVRHSARTDRRYGAPICWGLLPPWDQIGAITPWLVHELRALELEVICSTRGTPARLSRCSSIRRIRMTRRDRLRSFAPAGSGPST